jgi:hypothetical protein
LDSDFGVEGTIAADWWVTVSDWWFVRRDGVVIGWGSGEREREYACKVIDELYTSHVHLVTSSMQV